MSGVEAEESDAFENDADSQEDEDSEAEGGFFSRTGLGAALKSKFRTEPEEKLAEETEAWENEQEETPEENSAFIRSRNVHCAGKCRIETPRGLHDRNPCRQHN